jgi:hypothetical protein
MILEVWVAVVRHLVYTRISSVAENRHPRGGNRRVRDITGTL